MKTNKQKIDNYIQFIEDCAERVRARAYREMWAWVGDDSMYDFLVEYLGADLDEDEDAEDEDDDA